MEKNFFHKTSLVLNESPLANNYATKTPWKAHFFYTQWPYRYKRNADRVIRNILNVLHKIFNTSVFANLLGNLPAKRKYNF